MENKVVVVIYSFYEKNFKDCLLLIEYVKKVGKDFVLVVGGRQADSVNDFSSLKHDNSDWEFGAYKVGLNYAKQNLGCTSVVIVNDTFLANQGMGVFYIKKIIKLIESAHCDSPVIVGELLDFDTDFKMYGVCVNRWIRSSVFGLNKAAIDVVINNKVFDACADSVQIKNGALDFSAKLSISKDLINFIEKWLGLGGRKGVWHGLGRPGIDENFLRLKILSILRERWLSGAIASSGGELVNVVGDGLFDKILFKVYRRLVRYKCC